MTATYPLGPAADDVDAPYWDGLARGVIALPRCAACDVWRTPGRVRCASCWSDEVLWQEVAPRGSVYSWIRTHRDVMSELDVRAPYVTVLVALDDAPIRLLGMLSADASVRIGDRVEGYVITPAAASQSLLRWRLSS
ncbi:OB-fold domain-containing protein [Nocardioides sp. TRM66260-LWL]|uniref:Zn-ribbon domain-containing OB-fold protein n=1 Tax=Nocardioides sp. TRM66260-LWL TaxID=2874478 RepID=UPI001CC5FBDF|nr:OB-fold domain-containing protein [Nocardioides sp. TRM66260-LWL]MBZ5735301.1 OB-fold domain-containing protein [Nocardioides sp. TRM66260-LWL]